MAKRRTGHQMWTFAAMSGRLMRRAGLIGALFCGLSAAALPARADIFTVTGIDTEATAANAASAREIAHKRGRRTAFKALVKRMTRPADWLNIPELSDGELTRMDRGVKIRDERNSTRRYLATVDFSFDPIEVRKVLKDAGIPFSDSQARKAVVLPVLEVGGRRILWENGNPWADAWASKRLSHELTPVEAPLADLRDISSIDAGRALLAHWPDLQKFAGRYGDADVLVARAVLQPGTHQTMPVGEPNPSSLLPQPQEQSRSFTFGNQTMEDEAPVDQRGYGRSDAYGQSQDPYAQPEPQQESRFDAPMQPVAPTVEAGQTYTLSVSLWRVNDLGRKGYVVHTKGFLTPAQAKALAVASAARPDPFMGPGSAGIPSDGLSAEESEEPLPSLQGDMPKGPSIFAKAVDEAMELLARDWKSQTIVNYAENYELNATVRLASFKDWIDTRAALDKVATISDWDAGAISSTGAELKVVFSGTVDQLALNLGQQGFALSGRSGIWTVARRGLEQASLEDPYGQRPPVFRVQSFGQNEADPYGQPYYDEPYRPAPAETEESLPGPYDEGKTELRLRSGEAGRPQGYFPRTGQQ